MCYEEQKLSANGDEYLQKALAIQGTETKDYYNRGRISGWTPGNEEEDIVINGEEINPQTNNML